MCGPAAGAVASKALAAKASKTAQIQRALAMVAAGTAGTYGACAGCEEPIAIGRLRVRPEALLCVRCEASSGG
jgi:RNA polymerase-binding transcription factor DksA